jgi:hypothetical protein
MAQNELCGAVDEDAAAAAASMAAALNASQQRQMAAAGFLAESGATVVPGHPPVTQEGPGSHGWSWPVTLPDGSREMPSEPNGPAPHMGGAA